MDRRSEIRDFLVSRRAKITPEQAGLQLYGQNRRVQGLRREEVAVLAGVSADYYTKVERGNLAGVSDSVLDSIAAALQLDEAERIHLRDLAHITRERPHARRATARTTIRPGVQRVLDAMTTAPAYVRNGRFDIVALNRLGRALFADALQGHDGFNLARYLFLQPTSRDFYLGWEAVAKDCVASLRVEAGKHPHDKTLTDLIGELVTRSEEFAAWWASHNVKLHRTATKQIHHHTAGDLEVTGEALVLPGDDDLTIITYTVEPASPSAQALSFLGSWATDDADEPTGPPTANQAPHREH